MSSELEPTPAAEPIPITADMMTAEVKVRETREDFERGMSRWPVMAIVITVICTGILVWEFVIGAFDSESAIIAAGALHRESVLGGEVWRLVSAMFLHGGIEHLIGNCVMLIILGMAIEHAFGIGRAVVLYFASGLAGSLLSMTMHPGPSVGASGAIFGLAGGIIVFLYRHQKQFHLRDKRLGVVLLFWAIYTVVFGFFSPNVDNYAHIGGFVGGAIAGAILPQRRRAVLQATV